jgi:hypothetical protein
MTYFYYNKHYTYPCKIGLLHACALDEKQTLAMHYRQIQTFDEFESTLGEFTHLVNGYLTK